MHLFNKTAKKSIKSSYGFNFFKHSLYSSKESAYFYFLSLSVASSFNFSTSILTILSYILVIIVLASSFVSSIFNAYFTAFKASSS